MALNVPLSASSVFLLVLRSSNGSEPQQALSGAVWRRVSLHLVLLSPSSFPPSSMAAVAAAAAFHQQRNRPTSRSTATASDGRLTSDKPQATKQANAGRPREDSQTVNQQNRVSEIHAAEYNTSEARRKQAKPATAVDRHWHQRRERLPQQKQQRAFGTIALRQQWAPVTNCRCFGFTIAAAVRLRTASALPRHTGWLAG